MAGWAESQTLATSPALAARGLMALQAHLLHLQSVGLENTVHGDDHLYFITEANGLSSATCHIISAH
jgi:hypothetical protein